MSKVTVSEVCSQHKILCTSPMCRRSKTSPLHSTGKAQAAEVEEEEDAGDDAEADAKGYDEGGAAPSLGGSSADDDGGQVQGFWMSFELSVKPAEGIEAIPSLADLKGMSQGLRGLCEFVSGS